MSLKIIVADTEPTTAQLMRALATPLGHTVYAFADYQTAGQRSEAQAFDLAFVGMHGPDLDPFTLTHRIRDSHPNHPLFAVMVSPTDDIPNLRKAFGEGADMVLTKPIHADHLRRFLAAMDSPDWRRKKAAARLPLPAEVQCEWQGRQYALRSLNISETGILLQPALEAEIGAEVSLAFTIAEIPASLQVRARLARKEGNERMAMEFVALEPEQRNAIQLYVTGHLKEPKQREVSRSEPQRLFRF